MEAVNDSWIHTICDDYKLLFLMLDAGGVAQIIRFFFLMLFYILCINGAQMLGYIGK